MNIRITAYEEEEDDALSCDVCDKTIRKGIEVLVDEQTVIVAHKRCAPKIIAMINAALVRVQE